ncbi:hypothetical protein [Simplicispira suum]|uniref:hypothetical protein n=1 Tax=Simplicispira suum TaxID=2109915 RepID=UPI0023EA6AAB|nr:hypothetical protein [Simplicispira suum]
MNWAFFFFLYEPFASEHRHHWVGYVGLPLAVEFGKRRPVLGFDINTTRIAELQSGRDITLEVEAQDQATASQLRFGSVRVSVERANSFEFNGDFFAGQLRTQRPWRQAAPIQLSNVRKRPRAAPRSN